jgi:hypothetical protein
MVGNDNEGSPGAYHSGSRSKQRQIGKMFHHQHRIGRTHSSGTQPVEFWQTAPDHRTGPLRFCQKDRRYVAPENATRESSHYLTFTASQIEYDTVELADELLD